MTVGTESRALRGSGLGLETIARDAPPPVSRQGGLTTGHTTRAYLGVRFANSEPELAREFRLPVKDGIILTAVEPRSPAVRAGLRPQDIIVKGNADRRPRLDRYARPADAESRLFQEPTAWRLLWSEGAC